MKHAKTEQCFLLKYPPLMSITLSGVKQPDISKQRHHIIRHKKGAEDSDSLILEPADCELQWSGSSSASELSARDYKAMAMVSYDFVASDLRYRTPFTRKFAPT